MAETGNAKCIVINLNVVGKGKQLSWQIYRFIIELKEHKVNNSTDSPNF